MSDVSRPLHPGDPGDPGDPGSSGRSDAAPLPERPLGLSLLIWLFWFWAGAVVLVFLGFAIGEGPVMLGGRAMPRAEALAVVFPILLPMGLGAAGAALALGLGKPWARPPALLPFALALVAPAFSGAAATAVDLALSALILLPVMGGVAWYLYRSPEVRDYFARLRADPRRHPQAGRA